MDLLERAESFKHLEDTLAEVARGQGRLVLVSGEAGKWADLVFLDADPLTDIRNTRRIWNVMRDGRVVDRASLLHRKD